jgi:glycosyltransferase involved in cell wall biosynthesis
MPEKKLLLSVVVPAFNEENTIGDVISRLKVTIQKMDFDSEIIVIDDFSSDRTSEIARDQKIKVYSLRRHMGKGYALRVGFIKAKGEIIATIDSDGSHRPEELPHLLLPILQDKADLVIGSRFLRKKQVDGKRFNVAGVRIFNQLVRILTGKDFSDTQSGYRAMKTVVLERMVFDSAGYEIESEMLVKTALRGLRIQEVPISFKQRTYGRSSLDPIVDGLRILMSIITPYIKGGRK